MRQNLWNDTNIRIEHKIQLLDAGVFSILLYAADIWTLKKADEKRLAAFEMHCYSTEDCFVSDGRTSRPTNPSEDNSVANTPSWTESGVAS